MSPESLRQCTAELLKSDDLPKKDPIKFFQNNAAHSFLNEHRLLENIENVAVTTKKEQLVGAITSGFTRERWMTWKIGWIRAFEYCS
ncbi:peptidyl-prolyl cis-trans isomerase FKBP3-like [Stigmatopora nigra]